VSKQASAATGWTNPITLTDWVEKWTDVSTCNGWWGCPGSLPSPDDRIAGLRLDTDTDTSTRYKKFASMDNNWSIAPQLDVTYNSLPPQSVPSVPAQDQVFSTPTPAFSSSTVVDPD